MKKKKFISKDQQQTPQMEFNSNNFTDFYSPISIQQQNYSFLQQQQQQQQFQQFLQFQQNQAQTQNTLILQQQQRVSA